jgi:hypothetical protein
MNDDRTRFSSDTCRLPKCRLNPIRDATVSGAHSSSMNARHSSIRDWRDRNKKCNGDGRRIKACSKREREVGFRNYQPASRPHSAWPIDAPMRCAHTLLSIPIVVPLSPEANAASLFSSLRPMRNISRLVAMTVVAALTIPSRRPIKLLIFEELDKEIPGITQRVQAPHSPEYCIVLNTVVESAAHPGHHAHVDEDCLLFIILVSPSPPSTA